MEYINSGLCGGEIGTDRLGISRCAAKLIVVAKATAIIYKEF